MTHFNKLLILFFLTLLCNSAYSIVRYVKAGNPSTNTGLSWATACGDLQTMIDASSAGDDIWVAEGVYKPNSYPAGCTNCSSSRNYTFLLKEGVQVFGGFKGTELHLYQSKPKDYKTYLDGNIGNPSSQLDNVYHVVMAIENTAYSYLGGLYIQNGTANDYSTVSINRPLNIPLTIFNSRGGGIYVANCSSLTSMSEVTFLNNIGNTGAAFYGIGNSFTIIGTRLIFNNNLGLDYGGSISLDESRMEVNSSLFVDNEANVEGKIGDLFDNAQLDLENCTIYGNSPSSSTSLFNAEQNSELNINNSILWDNSDATATQIVRLASLSTSTVAKSIIEDGYSPCDSCPNTNGDISPIFVSTSDLDGFDNTFGTEDDGLQLSPCSPAIDYLFQESPYSTDLIENNRAIDYNFDKEQNLDIGAYEKQESADDVTNLYANVQLTTGTNNGNDWTNAFRGANALQTALLVAKSIYTCGSVVIHLAEGTYKPSVYPSACTTCSSATDYTFNLPANVSIIGGYSSDGSTQNSFYHETILDGNVGDITDSTDNVYHILTTTTKNGRPNRIDNITFKNGGNIDLSASNVSHTINGQTVYKNYGGAIYHQNAATLIQNCKFESNHGYRGALFVHNNASSYGNILQNLTFTNNVGIRFPTGSSYYSPTSSMYLSDSDFQLENITATQNRAENNVIISKDFEFHNSEIELKKSIFYNNHSYETIMSNSTNLFLQSSIFYNNRLKSLYIFLPSYITTSTLIDHCSIVNTNTQLFQRLVPVEVNAENVAVSNSAIWIPSGSLGNGLETHSSYTGTQPFVRNSVIYGGWTGCVDCPNTNGNIDPQFKNANSLFGTEGYNLDDGLRPQITSPLIDNGALLGGSSYSYSDLWGGSAVNNPEIGAYESNPDFCFNWRYYTDQNIPSNDYSAILKIKSEGIVQSGNDVSFGASSIELNPGFEVEAGAIFEADPNEACP